MVVGDGVGGCESGVAAAEVADCGHGVEVYRGDVEELDGGEDEDADVEGEGGGACDCMCDGEEEQDNGEEGFEGCED